MRRTGYTTPHAPVYVTVDASWQHRYPPRGQTRGFSESSKFRLLFVATAGTEEGYVRLGMAAELAGTIGARCLRLEKPRADSLVELIGRRGVA
jgi:Mg-chelatase subunit ChlD